MVPRSSTQATCRCSVKKRPLLPVCSRISASVVCAMGCTLAAGQAQQPSRQNAHLLTVADLRRAGHDDAITRLEAALETDLVPVSDAELHGTSAGEELVAALLHHEDTKRVRIVGRSYNRTQREDRDGGGFTGPGKHERGNDAGPQNVTAVRYGHLNGECPCPRIGRGSDRRDAAVAAARGPCRPDHLADPQLQPSPHATPAPQHPL